MEGLVGRMVGDRRDVSVRGRAFPCVSCLHTSRDPSSATHPAWMVSLPLTYQPTRPLNNMASHHVRTAVGPKDTAPADVYEVTYEEYEPPVRKEKKAAGAAAGEEGT